MSWNIIYFSLIIESLPSTLGLKKSMSLRYKGRGRPNSTLGPRGPPLAKRWLLGLL